MWPLFFLVQKGRIVYNQVNRLAGFNYAVGKGSSRWSSMHAEINAYKKYKRQCHRLRRTITLDLLVVRGRNFPNMDLASSQPCYHCLKELHMYAKHDNIRWSKVIYSCADGTLTCLSFHHLLNLDNPFRTSAHMKLKYNKVVV